MKKLILSFGILTIAFAASAQNTSPLYETYFSNPDRMVEDEDGGYHFDVRGGQTVVMKDDGYYKLTTADGAVIEEGDTDEEEDRFVRHGRWKTFYPNGTLQTEGSYLKGQPVGSWMFYGSGGNLQSEHNIAIIQNADGSVAYCKAGAEYIYHDNGKIKEERFYKAESIESTETIMVEDPETEKKVAKTIATTSYKPVAFGTWTYYNAQGEVTKSEDKK